MNECKTCGYVGEREHTEIYDCCDFVNPKWMHERIQRVNDRKFGYVLAERNIENFQGNFNSWVKSIEK